VTPNSFRRIALSMPGVVEASHMGHPDFRVGGKTRWSMVKLEPEQQARLVDARPEVFKPVAGGWGRKGSTTILLSAADTAAIAAALTTAWENTRRSRRRKSEPLSGSA
jgi:hypothetical protein